MALRHTYSSAAGFNPLPHIDRWLHPYRLTTTVMIRGRTIHIHWTDRALEAVEDRATPLYVEMQLYFSCVVKKRVLFYETPPASDFVVAGPRLHVRARTVESDVCSPEDFAAGYPARRELSSAGALRMVPRTLWLDYQGGQWVGEMAVGGP
ncbi:MULTISPECIES: hypothetical protein [unclassified Thioalkalivibrio]|uniref:hypothetical protein n=1 Tax=unclassified Thioalkalivibrio TaxID=2621013 RepID=UPI00036A59C7|nr:MULTISPECIES: hypothetical protein [unclassified Thioalkalivibrio]